MAMQFPDLFRCAKDMKVKVNSYAEVLGGKVIWRPVFGINLKAQEGEQLMSLLGIFEPVHISKDGEDSRI